MKLLYQCLFVMTAVACQATTVLADEPTELMMQLESVEQIYRSKGPETALPNFESLLQKAIDAQDRPAEATAQRFIGECHWLMGNFDTSGQHLNTALLLAREIDDRTLEGKTLNVLGLLHWDLGEFDKAITHFQTASDIGKTIGDLKLQGATLNNISLVYDELGDYHKSLDQYTQVLAIYSQTDFPRGEGDTLGNIGGVNLLLGRYSEALDYYHRALAISESLDSIPAMSQDHGNLGFVYSGLGQTETALQHFNIALELAEKAGMAQEKGYWLRGKANAEMMAGRYDLSLQHHREALAIYREISANVLLVDGLHDMGQLLLQLGDPISAQQYFEKAMELAQSLELTSSITNNQLALGDLQMRHLQLEDASALYRQALQGAMEGGETDLQIIAQLSLARVNIENQNFEQAQTAAISALGISKQQGNQPAQAAASLLEADILRLQGKFDDSLAQYQLADTYATEIGDPDLLWQIEFGRGQSLDGLGRKEEAVDALTAAVLHIESVRNRLREKRFRAGYLQDKREVYTWLVRLQLELDRDGDAFSTAERLRSFSFRQMSAPGPGANGQDPQIVEMRARIRQLQSALDEERSYPVPEQRQSAIETFSLDLLAAEQQFQAVMDDLEALDYQAEDSTNADEARRHLQDGETLIEYVVGSDDVMIFVLTPQALHTAMVPVTQKSLYSRVELLRDLLLERDNDRWKLPAASLARSLLQPALEAGWLEGARRLYLVPHDVLNYLPFATLTTGVVNKPQTLIELFDLSYLPTAASLAERHEEQIKEATVLSVAPQRGRLRHAPEEATAIAGLFEPNSKLLSGVAATETAVRELADEYGVLHLATHGYFNKLNPMLSGLELEADSANDGLLEVHEILELQLTSDLVTLSACETGMGGGFFTEIPAGDDFVGLTRAFLQAGSSSVLATLWQVDDLSTVDLMKDFYTHLEDTGVQGDKAVALAQAQRVLRATEEYSHPYYWAPFVLVGAAQARTNASG
jgi:CHAT domain-containing protein